MARPDRIGTHAALGSPEDLSAAALALARRFARGGTMWCVAPQWPAHARHVAVEFVHPVIVGKRALPAVSLGAADAVPAVRLLARRGDVLLTIGPSEDPVVADLLSRTEAWGLTSIWLGAGPRPDAGNGIRSNHLVWLEDGDPAVTARSGQLVLLYHLLWELTHVVFEHPGLVASELDCSGEVCVTCSDEGRVAEVRRILPNGRVEVVAGGQVEQIDGSLVEDLYPGHLVLVHAGVAVAGLSDADD